MNLAIEVSGRINSDNSGEFKALIDEKLATVGVNVSDVIFSIDMENLEYISSAGLRVIMGLLKKVKSVSIENASSEICNIFEVTGFNEMVNITKKLRSLSVEGLELIGTGATSKVYKLDKDTVVKVYDSTISLAAVKEEQHMTKKAIQHDIPTMISYDIVKVGDCYGVVYELFNGITLAKFLVDNPDKESEYCKMFADFVREANSIVISDKEIPSAKKVFYERIDSLEESGFYTKEQADTFRGLIFVIPDANTFVHGDCHPGNVMFSDNELFFIDLPTIVKGSPIFDIKGMAWYRLAPEVLSEEKIMEIVGVPKDRLVRIWREFLKYYFKTDDETTINRLDKQFYALECFDLSSLHEIVPNLFSPGTEKWLIMEGLKAADYDWDIF